MYIILRIKIFDKGTTKNVLKFPDLFSSSFRLQKNFFVIQTQYRNQVTFSVS